MAVGQRAGRDHVIMVSRAPIMAQDVAPEVKLALARDLVLASGANPLLADIFSAVIPFFVDKDPRNPVSP